MCNSFLLSCLPRLKLPGIQDGSAGTPIELCLLEVLVIIIKSFLMEMDPVILKGIEVSCHGLSYNEANPWDFQCPSPHTDLKLTLSCENTAASLQDQGFPGT